MATGDFQDLYTRTLYAAQRGTTVSFDTNRAKEAVNEAYLSLCDTGDQWAWLQVSGTHSFVLNQSSYTFSSVATSLGVGANGIYDVVAVSFNGPAGSSPGHYARWEDFYAIKQLNPSLAAGVPHLWTTYSRSTVEVWPKPDTTYSATVLALRQPALLSLDADVPLVPLAWRFRLIVPLAASILLRQEGGEALSESAAHTQLYEKALEEARKTLVLRPPVEQPTQFQILLPSSLRGAANTFLGVVQRVCYEAGLRPWMSYDLFQAKNAVNSVVRSILDLSEDWDFLEREGQIILTAGQDTYTIASVASALGVTSIKELLMLVHDTESIAGRGRLQAMSWSDLELLAKSTQDGEATGVPSSYSVWDGKFRVWPSPDQAYTLGCYYLLGSGEVTSDTASLVIPDEWVNEVVVPLAAARVLQQANDGNAVNKSNVLEGRGQSALKAFRESHGSARNPTLRLSSPTWNQDLPGSYYDDWAP